MSAQASEEELIGAILFVVSPVNEDPESYRAVMSVCGCALEKAKEEWSSESYANFTTDLMDYAMIFESAVNPTEGLIANGVPGKSESLMRGLKNLTPYIIECEKKFDTRVEF